MPSEPPFVSTIIFLAALFISGICAYILNEAGRDILDMLFNAFCRLLLGRREIEFPFTAATYTTVIRTLSFIWALLAFFACVVLSSRISEIFGQAFVRLFEEITWPEIALVGSLIAAPLAGKILMRYSNPPKA